MKLSDLRACVCCRKPLMQAPQVRPFYVLTIAAAFVNPGKANRVLGLAHALGGDFGPAFGIAEVMSPDTDEAVAVMPDPPRLFLCLECATDPKHGFWHLLEKRRDDDATPRAHPTVAGDRLPTPA